MNTDLFIVTFKRDFPYLQWCFKSILKFATGFRFVWLVIPKDDLSALASIVAELPFHQQDWFIPVMFQEWPEQGMLHHMNIIMHSDEYTDADFICHIDSDCIFTAPVTPETYIKDGKPILRYEPFDSILKRHPGIAWREVTQRALPFVVRNETMRCHPEVYHRGLYAEARRLIEKRTGKSCKDYIRSGPNAFPQQFCEFNTLGNVAMKYFEELYECVEQTGDQVTPDNHLQQFWSHGALDEPQQIWVKGVEQSVVPMDFIKQVFK